MLFEAVSKTRKFVVTGGGRLGCGFVIDSKLGNDSVMESVSTIINLVITGDGILGW